ncbi:CoA-binding protein [Janthinobacterium violaceinigrum]|uniref:CoA-binding protein n=1 Tax=Janthinobacterium violaceinigrum TaxID=2654252 RepID=A0A6I1HXD7_9BURK|nr:CoA-binding protein [Janthinobacterium violaceinigrum]KAB8063285.1 CoA-binding protein [Janthinobacterium violaceinigrum]
MSNIARILQDSRIIAIVGMSDKPERASHEVADYLLQHGYRVLPVNPALAGKQVLGQHAYASLTEAAVAVAPARIDIVDCFRKPADILPIAEEAIAVQARCLWLQLEVVNEEAARLARAAGLEVVMDHCTKIEHRKQAVAA